MTNFIHKDTTEEDKEGLFGPFEDDVFIEIDDTTKLEDLVVTHLKKFPSKGQARKNGWGGNIPMGFREWRVGKTFFWTYKPIEWVDPEVENI